MAVTAHAEPITDEPNPTSPNTQHNYHRSHFPHPHIHGRRLFEFIHPHSGTTFHICQTPEDLEKKKSELLRQETKVDDFNVVLHGSPEHLDAIRDLHSHHEDRRNRLREQHTEIYDQFEAVKGELDLLNEELHRLTSHAVALDASFDKYGYSARLRTTDSSETSSLNDDHSAEAKHHDRSIRALKFFKRPQIRQYFHRGLLWRSSQSGEVASFELFCDLIYVGVIDVIGEVAVEHPSGSSLLHFVIAFSLGWKIWSIVLTLDLADLTTIVNWFVIDDVVHRLCVCFYLVCLLGFTTNISYMFEAEESTYMSALSFYVTQRLYTAAWFLLVAFLVPTIRGTMVANIIIILISSALWIGSMHVEWPGQLALILIPLTLDLFGGFSIIVLVKRMCKGSGIGKQFQKWFEFYPAINIEHRVERNNAFVALVFGYSILTILYQSHASFGINSFFAKAALSLLQSFAFNWLYFDIDSSNIHVHAIRRHWLSSTTWITGHLPFIMGFVLAASTLSQLVLAHDCADSDPTSLGAHYYDRSVGEVDQAMRWYYCGGLGVALFSMSVLSFCHVHKRLPNARLRKRPRLACRVAVAILIICLPLIEGLSSLDLVAFTSSLIILILCLDIFGSSCAGDRFWTGGMCVIQRRKCTYTAQCKLGKQKRKELQRALFERGEKVGIDDLLEKQRNASVSSFDTDATLRDEEWHGGHI